MRRILMTAALPLALLHGGAAGVGAQTHQARVTITAGAGLANPMHSDLQFTAPTWHLGVGTNPARLVTIEGTYAEWRHKDATVRTDVPVTNIAGPVGRIGRLTEETVRVTRTVGFNVLFRAPVGKFALWGGGGPGMMFFSRDFTQTASDCLGAVTCSAFRNTHAASSFAAQGIGGVDVRLSGAMALFAQYSAVVPVRDPGSMHLAATGGVRLAF